MSTATTTALAGASGGPGGPPAASASSVTAVFVRLKLSLLRNGLRQSSGRTVAYVASIVVTLLIAAGQLLGLIALRGSSHAPALVAALVAVLALGWAAMPLFFPSGDETLDPTRLVMLPLRPRQVVVSLLVASLVGIGPLFTLTLAVGSVIALAHGPAAVVAAMLAVPLVVLVCVALARAVAAGNIRLLTSRRGRDLAVLSGLVVAVGAQLVNLGVQKLARPDGLAVLEPAAHVLRWIPPVAAVDAVRTAGAGAYAQACAQLLLSAVALVMLLRWWQYSLTRLMTEPDGSTLQAATQDDSKPGRSALGRGAATLIRRLAVARTAGAEAPEVPGRATARRPHDRTGTVMRRTLRYAWRDPKMKAAWATSLAVGLLLPVVTAVQGRGSVYTACWAAGLLGMQMYNQFGQDSSAFWMVALTISSPREAYLELRGRALALAAVALPYVTLVVLGSAALRGAWSAFPEALGLSLALLGTLLGTGAVASALFPYSIPQDSGYRNVAPGQVGLAWISIFGGVIVGALLCTPLLALTISLHIAGAHGWLWLILPVGTAYGLALACLGLRLAAPRTAARLPEILTAVSKG